MSTIFLDLENGSDAADGTSFANRVKTWYTASSLLAPGDTLKVMASVGPVAMSKTAAWVNQAAKLTLSGAVNADIDTGDAAWTASANVTCTNSTTHKEGRFAASIAVATAFTTGLAAYKAMSSTDFSGYQQITFWIMQTAGTLGAAASCSIKLCSDAAGATPVDTLDIPAIIALNVWQPITINKGSALGSAIQSVALYINTDNAAQTFLIDNISAVKASGNQDELHLRMLIGKASSIGAGGTDTQTWYSIRAIRGTTIWLDSSYASRPDNDTPVCCNSTETVTAYTFAPSYLPSTVVNADLGAIFPGSPASHITVSGGWDRVAMSSQTGCTIFSFPNGTSAGNISWNAGWTDFSKIGFARSVGGINFNPCFNCTLNLCQFIGVASTVSLIGNDLVATNCAITSAVGLSVQGVGASFAGLIDAHASTIQATGGATITVSTGSFAGLVTAAYGSGVVTYNGTTYGSLTLSTLTEANVRSAVGLAAPDLDGRLPAALTADGNMKADTLRINGNAFAAAALANTYAAFETGTAQGGAASTVTLRAGAAASNDFYKDQVVFLLSGTGAGQTNRISGYVGATKVATVETSWYVQPDNTSVYLVLGRVG